MLELQPFGILLASCGLEMNNGRQHRQLSAPLAPSSPSQCPPGTPQVPATWKINPPASLITVMCQEPCSRSASQIPVINSLQFAAALLGRSRAAAGRAPWDEHPGHPRCSGVRYSRSEPADTGGSRLRSPPQGGWQPGLAASPRVPLCCPAEGPPYHLCLPAGWLGQEPSAPSPLLTAEQGGWFELLTLGSN